MSEHEQVGIRGWTYRVTSDVRQLADIVSATGVCALLIETAKLKTLEEKAHQEFVRRFGSASKYTQTFLSDAPLICAGCQRQIPPSLCMALRNSGVLKKAAIVFGSVSSREDVFAATGRCLRCGSAQSYLVVDVIPADTIAQADVDVIKHYARHLAKKLQGITGQVSCHECDESIQETSGLTIGLATYCEPCYDHKYRNMLEILRRKPNVLEVSLVRKAWAFAVGGGKTM